MMNALRGPLLIGFFLILGAVAIGGSFWWPKHSAPTSSKDKPATSLPLDDPAAPHPDDPLVFQAVPPETAQVLNAARPDYIGSLAIARPLFLPKSAVVDGSAERALDCLTAAIYYEARSESAQGQRAVAQVVLNRARDPLFPGSVCGVVFQGADRVTGCQFSFTCDGSLSVPPREPAWERTRVVARAALAGYVEPSVGLATHYHTQWVVPVWRTDLVKLRTIGAHIFYGWRGRERSGSGLRVSYAGMEPPLWPGLAAYAALAMDDTPVVDPTASAFGSTPTPPQNGLITASAAPSAPLSKPVRADESHGALVAHQSRLKIDDGSPTPLSKLGGVAPK